MDPEDGLPVPQRYWAILTLMVGVALSCLDTALVNVALPRIAKDLNSARRLCHGNFIEHALRAETRQELCGCDGILPLCGRFGSEVPQCGSGDEVSLKVEGVVNHTVQA
jgi:hypothetical protein